MTRDLIHAYKDGDQWCAIYPMGSNLMDCQAVSFHEEVIRFNEHISRERDYGRHLVVENLRRKNPSIKCSVYCEYWD